MSTRRQTRVSGDDKPAKPYADFPLFAHATRRWAKKIRGQLHYFGPWNDPDGALQKYLDQKDARHAGRKPRPDAKAFTAKDMANAFLNHKQAMVDSGELSCRTWREYKETTDLLIGQLGKRRLVADLAPDDFAKMRKPAIKGRATTSWAMPTRAWPRTMSSVLATLD